MISPKDALKEAITWWPIDAGDRVPAMLLAAIPVAELHEQAVALFEDYGKRGLNMPIGVILALLTQLEEALK